MASINQTDGRSGRLTATAAAVIAGVVIVATLGVGGWLAWRSSQNNGAALNTASNPAALPTAIDNLSPGPTGTPAGQAKAGAFVAIKEWGVKFAVPDELKDSVTYRLGLATPDENNNTLQNAVIFVAKTNFPDVICGEESTAVGAAFNSGAQFIRSESGKPFNAARYDRSRVKQSVLSKGGHDFHLNYVLPDCAGGSANAALLGSLHDALVDIKQSE